MKRVNVFIVILIFLVNIGTVYGSSTLDTVKKKGFIQCGVSQGVPGFSNFDEKGNWKGIDVDYCRAVAAAIFNDSNKVKYTSLSGKDRFTALQSKEVDILSRNTSWTITRDTQQGFNFAGVIYYDGQGVMVHKKLGIKSVKDLNGASICIHAGTTTELNLADYFRTNKMEYKPIVFEKVDEVVAAYDSGRCEAITTDVSQLYAQRIKLKNADDNVILPDIISKEPLSPLVRQGDDEWFNIAQWTLFAMINAEELGVTSKNVESMKKGSKNPEIQRLLGVIDDIGKALNLSNDWAYNIIKQVGNYGEIFDRNVGVDSQLKIERGLNQLWNKGGILYAPPIR
jgi:general L-amino acid transport system substrate-binding protein